MVRAQVLRHEGSKADSIKSHLALAPDLDAGRHAVLIVVGGRQARVGIEEVIVERPGEPVVEPPDQAGPRPQDQLGLVDALEILVFGAKAAADRQIVAQIMRDIDAPGVIARAAR